MSGSLDDSLISHLSDDETDLHLSSDDEEDALLLQQQETVMANITPIPYHTIP